MASVADGVNRGNTNEIFGSGGIIGYGAFTPGVVVVMGGFNLISIRYLRRSLAIFRQRNVRLYKLWNLGIFEGFCFI